MPTRRVVPSAAALAVSLCFTAAALADTAIFQQGTGGYTGCVDTMLKQATPDTPTGSGVNILKWDTDDTPTYPGFSYVLLRFDNIFGSGAGKVPPGSVITSATLTYYVSNGGNSANLNEAAVSWSASTTWNGFGDTAGVAPEDYGAAVGTATGTVSTFNSLSVTTSVAAWSANPAANLGWIFLPTGTDGVELYRSNHATVASRPKLTINYTPLTRVDLYPAQVTGFAGASIPVSVSIPPGSNASTAVHVTVTSNNPAVAMPEGAVGGSVVLTFDVGAATQQQIAMILANAGTATLTTTNDAGVTNDSMPVTVNASVVSLSPTSVLAIQGRPTPLRVNISPGCNDTRTVLVTLTSDNPGVIAPAGGVNGSRTLIFAQNAPCEQRIWLTPGSTGEAVMTTTNSAGLTNTSLSASTSTGFTFTATADPRTQAARFDTVLASINDDAGGPGVFHVSPGDIDPPAPLRAFIDSRFGPSAIWFPGIGNHEEETAEDMTWLRSEYLTGNGVRTPLANATRQDGPTGTIETTYTWEHGNALFIMLNEYWNGGTAAGSDVATDGDVVPALYDWLAAKLNANDKMAVFVFGHEPAYPENRHVGDSLDQYDTNRNNFWSLLEDRRVQAYICGHTHYYSRYQLHTGKTWQVDLGNAGNDEGDGQTFLNVTVTPALVRYDIWRNDTGTWELAEYWTEPLRVAPDLDRDGDVDQEDFGRMQRCLTGTGVVTETDCLDADLDHNTHVDTDDLDRLVNCMSAPDALVTTCP